MSRKKKEELVEEVVETTAETPIEGNESIDAVDSVDEVKDVTPESATEEVVDTSVNLETAPDLPAATEEAGPEESELDTDVSVKSDADSVSETEDSEEVIEIEEDDEEIIDAEVDLSDLPESYGDKDGQEPDADITNEGDPDGNSFVDPLPEKEGDYYLDVVIGIGKREVVEERLRKYEIGFIVTALGNVLVGPYLTPEDATKGRRELLGRGFKGTVVKVED